MKFTALPVLCVCFLTIGCSKKVAVRTPDAHPVQTARTEPPPPPAPVTRSAPAAVTPSAPRRSDFPDAATRAKIEDLVARIQDAYFDYDKHALRSDAQSTLTADATALGEILKQYPAYKLTIEGHCDERGSDEYNLALGDARAKTAKDFLTQFGIPADSLNVVSLGKEKPQCTEHDESCWQKNRRAHIVTMARAQ